ncbi:MAG TPA: PAS domain S-box protein [Thermodesulfovibrionales bacterium]|nr:PAS domain S-box protein [Thermodesulfovibrionales bacterium]
MPLVVVPIIIYFIEKTKEIIRSKDQLLREIDERRKAEEELRREKTFVENALNVLQETFFVFDTKGRFLRWNETVKTVTGYGDEEISSMKPVDFFPEEERQRVTEAIEAVMKTGYTVLETVVLTKDGRQIPFKFTGSLLKDRGGRIVGISGTGTDITERIQKEEELGKLTRILRARNKSSRAMMEAEDEHWYLNEVCRIIVEDCGHAMVWIGFADDNEDRTVRPMAHAGFEEGYLESLNLTWADRQRGRGPVGTAIRTGKPVIVQDTRTDDRFEPWRVEAVRRGYTSVIAVPLLSGGKVFGSLNIYSGRPNSFTEEEAVLLTDVAADLSYGIASIRLRAAEAESKMALQKSEERYRSLFENMLEGFAYCKMLFEDGQPQDFIYLDVNSAFEKLTGLRDVVGKRVSEVIPGIQDTNPELFEIYGRVAVTGEPERFEMFVEALKMWFSISVYSPAKEFFVAIFDVITERKLTEELLRESENKFRSLAEKSLVGIYIIQDDKFRYVNPMLAEIFGYTVEELIDEKGPEDLTLPQDWPIVKENLRKRISGEIQSSQHSFRGIKKNKESIHVDAFGSRTVYKARPAVVGTLLDVTERKQAEEALRRNEEQLKEAQHLAHIGSWELDLVSNSLFWSDEIYQIFEIDKNDFGASYEAFLATVHPDDREAVDKAYRASVRNKSPYEIVHRLKFPDGRIKFVQERCQTFYHVEGHPLRSIGTVQDVTERKLAEERLFRHLQRLSALRSIDLTISSSLDIRMTLKIFLHHVVTQLVVDAASVLLLNPSTRTLDYAASQGFRTSALRHSHLRLGEGYAGVAALENRIVNIHNLKEEDSIFTRMEPLKSEDFITYYGVPLVAKGNVKGVLEIFHRSPLEPDEEWFDFLDALALQAAIAIDNNSLFYDLERSNTDLTLAYDSTIEGWSHALDYKDKETEGHSRRVTELTLRIAREMGMTEDELVHVRRGALLHDIGKMGIPDSILLKPGSLTEKEWKIMRQHPVYSYELLYPITYLRPALDIPYCHHEKWDGTGYPRGLSGEQIPLSARIFAVIDVWDALCSDRPYRPAWSEEKAREHIRSLSGIQFDPKVVEAFFKAITERHDYSSGKGGEEKEE